jgi:hypothetical protein
MPDVRSVAVGATTVGANFEKFQINTSDAGRELIVKIDRVGGTDALTTDHLLAAYSQLTRAFGTGDGIPTTGKDAGTFAAFGTADGKRVQDVAGTLREDTGLAIPANEDAITSVFVRLQTTGTPNVDALVVTGANVQFTTIAVFQAAK